MQTVTGAHRHGPNRQRSEPLCVCGLPGSPTCVGPEQSKRLGSGLHPEEENSPSLQLRQEGTHNDNWGKSRYCGSTAYVRLSRKVYPRLALLGQGSAYGENARQRGLRRAACCLDVCTNKDT